LLKASYRFVTSDGNPHRLKSGYKSCAGQSAGARVATEYGRILQDEQGDAVDIQLAGKDDETMDMDRNAETMDRPPPEHNWVPILRRGLGDQIWLCKVWDEIYGNSRFSYLADCSRPVFSLELEKICKDKARKRGAPRFLYEGEIGYLVRLSGRYGEDVEASRSDGAESGAKSGPTDGRGVEEID